jgi:hypothetical protein
MSYTLEERDNQSGHVIPWHPEILPCSLRASGNRRFHGQAFGIVHHDFRPEKMA